MSSATNTNPLITFSTFRTETLNGFHEFKIMGYSLNKGLRVGKYIESKTFIAGGYEWTIRLYPQGCDVEVNAYISICVSLASNQTNVSATVDLMLMDQSGRNQVIMHRGLTSFKSRGNMWGIARFVERSVLETSNCIKDDCLVIRARVGVVVRSLTRESELYSIRVPSSNIGQQFGQFLESGEGSDIRFEVGGESFAPHKFVLAVRSPVFKAQFLGPMKDDHQRECIQIVDMEAAVFKVLLHFIYWDVVPDLDYLFTQHLLEAADRYGLERLQLICESKLSEGISIDNAATTLALADQHHCFQLKLVCLQFIAQRKNLKGVMQSEGFTHLEHNCPSVVCELMHTSRWAMLETTTNKSYNQW